MNYLARLIGYSVLLLLVFLGATVGAQAWLRQQTQRLRLDAIESKRTQFRAISRVVAPAGRGWQSRDEDTLGAMVGGKVVIRPVDSSMSPAEAAFVSFDEQLENGFYTPVMARVSFPVSPITRLLATYQRVMVGLAVFATALVLLGVFFAALHRRDVAGRDGVTPHRATRAEVQSLAHLAKNTVAQNVALIRERDERRLAVEDAQLKQQLLNQSLEGKVRLGHDLHDGIIQSLYAAGLTIESARELARTNPEEADRLLNQCVQNLNGTIRDVRAYITGLAPNHLRQASFARAIETLAAELGGGRPVKLDLKIDEEAAAVLAPQQSTEALQIAREAISNSLRHGGASFITVRLHQVDGEVCLLVQDNGTGFDQQKAKGSGFGLGNMQARADRAGAAVRVESAPSAGTRVVLTVPVRPPS